MGEKIKKYEGNDFFYFVANAKNDSPDRIKAGDDYEKIYNANSNPKFQFQKEFYIKNHNSMVPPALFDGIQFIFKDYKNLDNYKTFASYSNNYKTDMKNLYGIEVEYSLNDLNNSLSHIIENKDVNQLENYLAFVEEKKLWKNGVMKKPGGMDAMNRGNFFYHSGALYKSAKIYEEAYKELNITVEPKVYFGNFNKIVKNFKEIKEYKRLLELLIKSKDFASKNTIWEPGNKPTLLKLNYLIATLSSEHNIFKKEGKIAKLYCLNNYYKNKLFELEEIKTLRI